MDILFERRVVLGGAEIGTVVNGHNIVWGEKNVLTYIKFSTNINIVIFICLMDLACQKMPLLTIHKSM